MNMPAGRIELYHLKGNIKRTASAVVFEIDTGSTILEMHFGDPVELMNLFVLAMEEMAIVFPDFEASKLWKDENFK